jgi:hypothetical protein
MQEKSSEKLMDSRPHRRRLAIPVLLLVAPSITLAA